MIEKITDRSRRHALPLHQVKNDAGIEVAAAAAHRQTVECREAHGRRYAFAPEHRAHAGAAAEMRNHDATVRCCRTKEVREYTGDVFIRKAMEPVSSNALGGEPARQRKGGGDLRLRMVEGGVEACDLRQCGVKLRERIDSGKVMRLMERRQRDEAA